MGTVDNVEKSVNIIGKIAEIIKKNGLIITLIAVMLFGAGVGSVMCYKVFKLNEEFGVTIRKQNQEAEYYKDKEHSESNKIREEIKPQVDQIIEHTMDKLDCDRCYVIEMHNGNNNPSGLPFIYGEMTYEESVYDVDDVDDEYMSINLSRYKFPMYLKNNTMFIGTLDEMRDIDPKLTKKLESDDVTYVAMVVINGTEGEIGLFGVSYCNGNEPKNDEVIKTLFMTESQKLSHYLDKKRHIK